MKVITEVPAAMAVATPVPASIVTLAVLLLLHDPLPEAESVAIPPTHTLVVPDIAPTPALTVISVTV
jgi:hypothetical protein